MRSVIGLALLVLLGHVTAQGQESFRPRAREVGIEVGILQPGPLNAITDVPGVLVGHRTLVRGDSVRTGVTAILPHGGDLFREKVPAAVYTANGFGKATGFTQIEELGELETPIVLTNTLSVPIAAQALIRYTLSQPGHQDVRSVNPVVGETNDSSLNDIRGLHVTEGDVLAAIRAASEGSVEEGAVGAGTGTVAFGFKGGIGTSSRVLPPSLGGYTAGVLVQTNYGGVLTINGAPVGKVLGRHYLDDMGGSERGSCMMIVATDAPLGARNLKRLAKRAVVGLARTGATMTNGSGDYVIAFSTHPGGRIAHGASDVQTVPRLANGAMSPLFQAVAEATEEAIYNSLFKATTTTGRDGHTVEALPLGQVLEILDRHGARRKP